MTKQLCPERTILAAFGRGELAEEQFEQIATHIVDCANCQELLELLGNGSDALLAGLRQVRGKDGADPRLNTYSTQHGSSTATTAVRTPPGYELLDEVGRGGMGLVYRARDGRLNREVAIKLLRDDCRVDAAVRARFVAEAQITGQLQHPGIPAVHELGQLTDGRPFLAMKLVKGRTLHQLLHERNEPSQERGRYLAIFEQICQAVGYAHAHRVLHRDLKPSNVMVGAFGEVQVMDWGLAKVLPAQAPPEPDEGELPETLLPMTAIETPQPVVSATRTGSVMGTPAYMAPEQAGGEIRKLDARSDVFGLGAILCEILTGLPPYQGKDVHAIRLQAVRGELTETLTRLDACGAEPEVVALCQCCLAFKQEDRPADGGAVAAAVASIRQAAEERARRAELERAEALVREAEQRKRRRVWLGLAACLLMGLLASTALGLWANHARQQAEMAQVAESAAREAEKERAEGERLAKQAAVAANEQAQKRLKQIEKGNEILAAIFTDLDLRELKQSNEPLEGVLAKRLVKAGEQLEGEAIGDPLTVADLQNHLGESLLSLGHPRPAVALFEKAQAARSSLLGADHRHTLDSMNNLAVAYQEAGQLSKALPLYKETLRLRKASLGLDYPDTLTSMNNLALGYQAARHLDKALPLFEEALQLRKAKLGLDHAHTLQSMNNLAYGYQAAGQLEKALPLQEEALHLSQAKLGIDHLSTLASMNNLALGYQKAGRLHKALPLYEETLRLCKAKLGSNHSYTLGSMHSLAYGYHATGQLSKAVALYEEALKLRQDKLGLDHPLTLTCMGSLAIAYCDAKWGEKAVPLFAEYVARQRKRAKPNDPDFAGELASIAQKLLSCKCYKEAESYLRECLAICTEIQPDSWRVLSIQSLLGGALLGQKKYAEAEPLLLKSYEGMRKLMAKIPTTGQINLFVTATRLVQLYDAWGKPMEASKWRKELAQDKTKETKPKDESRQAPPNPRSDVPKK